MTVDVYDMNDFPAPSAGVITLVTGTLYRIKAPLTTSDRFLFPASSDIAMETEHPANAVITYTGTNILFSSTGGITRLVMDNVAVVATMSISQVWGMIGAAATFGSLFVNNCSFLGFTIIGTWTDFPFAFNIGSNYAGFTSGLTMTDCVVTAQSNTGFTADPSSTGPNIKLLGNKVTRAQFNTLQTFVPAASEILDIDPDIDPNAVVFIERIVKLGTGTFFSSTASKTIDTFADAGFTIETITSVSDNGGIARFNFTAPPTLFVDQEVTITAFVTNTTYNTTARITVVGAGFFEIGIAFTGSEASVGMFISNTVTCGSVAHGFANGTSLLITDSLNYDGGAKVYNTQSGSFQINRNFVADETAIAIEGSLDETDKRMFVFNNGDQKDSATIGSIDFNGNTDITSITDDTYVDIDMGVALAGANIERFDLIDTTNGQLRYAGQNPFSGTLFATFHTNIGATSEGDYRFAISINGVVPTFATAAYMPMSVKDVGDAVTLVMAVALNPSDTIKIMIAGDGSSVPDVVIGHGQLSIE